MLILDVFTGACLFLPMALPKIAGSGGLLALVLGLLFSWLNGEWLFYCLKKKINIQKYVCFGIRLLCGLRCFCVYVFLMGLFGNVLSETFLYAMPKWVILAGMTAVVMYGASKGIEVRARLSELFIYAILIPIVVIGLFSLPEADWEMLVQISDTSVLGIFQGMLVTWVLMAPLEWLCYAEWDEKQRQPEKTFRWSLCIGGGLVVVIYGLCVLVLGNTGMRSERWPTAILMQIVRIPGGFLSRQDGLMLSFWIFAMFMSLSGAVSHLQGLWHKNEKHGRMIFVYAAVGTIAAYFTGMNPTFLTIYFEFMIVTGILLLWLIPSLRFFFYRKKKIGCAVLAIIFLTGLLTGCDVYVALENRQLVMAVGVDLGTEKEYCFSYALPDFGEVTGKDSEKKKAPIVLEADSVLEAEHYFNQISDKVLDYGQVKVLVLGKDLCADTQALEQMLGEMKRKTEISRTLLICKSEGDAQEIIKKDTEFEGSVGLYVSSLLENNQREVILNDFIQNSTEIALPKIGVRKDIGIFLSK